jgi:hypothetical protein
MYKFLLLIPLFAILFAACRTNPLSKSEIPITNQAGSVERMALPGGGSLYFPRQRATDEVMEALAEGPLSLIDGCLRVGTPGYEDPGFLVLWPAVASVHMAEAGIIEVLDGNQQVVGRVGETIRLGGGAMESQATMELWERMITGLPIAGCPGPYWVAGAMYPLAAGESAGSE